MLVFELGLSRRGEGERGENGDKERRRYVLTVIRLPLIVLFPSLFYIGKA